MYATIDEILHGDSPFQTISIRYTGRLPPNPPHWMTETYHQLCTWDSHFALTNSCITNLQPVTLRMSLITSHTVQA